MSSKNNDSKIDLSKNLSTSLAVNVKTSAKLIQHSDSLAASRWNKTKIRSLRLSLGYSQAEFARRLSMETSQIDFMEQGLLVPSPLLSGDLEILMRQVESDCEENRNSKLVECKVDDRL